MGNLRRLAKGAPCMVRAPGVCNYDTETTVLAHVRRANVAGYGQKPLDLQAVLACSACHDLIDRRTHVRQFHGLEVDQMTLDALLRTIEWFLREHPVAVSNYVEMFW